MPLGSSDPLPAWHRMVRKLLRTIHSWWAPIRHQRRPKKLPPPEAPNDDDDDDDDDGDEGHFDLCGDCLRFDSLAGVNAFTFLFESLACQALSFRYIYIRLKYHVNAALIGHWL